MKKLLALLLFTVFFLGNSYELLNKWLIPDSVLVYQSDSLFNHIFLGTRDSLANFNFNSCISGMNSTLVSEMPLLIAKGVDNNSSYIVRYAHIYDQFGNFRDNWYGIHSTGLTAQGEVETFSITLNDSAYAPWGNVSPSSSMVDINTTLRHEVGHALGISHSQFSSSLMYEHPTGAPWTNPILFIANDEINALRNVYSPPAFNSVTSISSSFSVNPGDTIAVFTKDTLTVDLKLPEMLIYESVTPPALKPIAFMNSASMTDTLTYTTIGTGIYRFKIPTDNLNLSSTNLLRTFVRRATMNNDLSNYITQKSPLSKLYIDVSTRQCRVDLPLPATESWFDFETRLNFEGSIVAEPSFVDSLDNVLIGFDVYDDYNTETNGFPISIFEWYYPEYFACDSNAYFCYFEKNAKSRPLERKVLSTDEKEKIKDSKSMKFFDASKFFDGSQDSKELTDYFAFSYRYPHSLDLVPGTYTVYMMAIRKDLYEADGTISEIAKSDSSQFIIPFWKMKLRRDYWFANTVVPYKQNLEYEAGKTMEVLFWIPWDMPPYNLMNLDIVRETDNTVVDNLTYDMNKKSFVLNWNIPSETVPGFYNLKASNLDYWTNITVNQQIDPQVCPLYLSWENSGDWPENWPGSDTADWEIHAGAAWTPAMGAYSLGAKYSTEGNTGLLSIQKSISVDSEWESVLEFAIGVEKEVGTLNFDPLLADYSIATSKDGANWTIEKTAVLSDYTSLSWSLEAGHCLVKYFRPLGDISNLGVKFIKNGIVTSPPDSQVTLFDEVKVVLTKTPLKTGPTNPSAQYAGGNVNVGWGSATKNSKGLDYYYVYRNGTKIGETTALTFVDSTVSANTFYNYAITAHYDDGSAYPESPMNECSVSIYTGLYSPSNLVITNENPNIRLTWSPVSGASEYKVYSSNDPYGTFTEDTTGTFNGEEWVAPLTESKLFYYVVAVNESMKVKKILKASGNQVK